MRSRLIAGVVVAVGTLAAAIVTAGALPMFDSDERYTGGGPRNGAFGGVSLVPKATVSYPSSHAAGTIVISTAERRLYYVLGNGQAIRYGIGVGRPGFTWSGVRSVSMKREWPDWTP